ncbi:MAG: cbb3-type cytochrome c oxidase subunit I, partial [Actinomycetota bacterium]
IFRGTVDTILDALVLGGIALIFLVHAVSAFLGTDLSAGWFDALLYKNIYWWGLDLIADGLVLIYVAGTWYLLVTLITGQKLFMQNVARAALLVELVVSWNVWGHHLLSDQSQPFFMKILSGELVTAFELVTMGIAVFVTLMTLWRARPIEMSPPLKFLLGGILGFSLGVPAGIIQADLGMNRILHNTQWVIGAHAHMQILVGLGMTIFAAVYALFPMLTNNLGLKSMRLTNFHFWAHLIGSVGMSVAMGFAGMSGMLRRTLYPGDDTFQTEMIAAAAFGTLILLSYLALMYNIISTIGVRGLIEIFVKLPGKKIREAEATSQA